MKDSESVLCLEYLSLSYYNEFSSFFPHSYPGTMKEKFFTHNRYTIPV